MSALERPSVTAAFTQWAVQPVAIAFVVALVVGYAVGVRRLRRAGRTWPAGRAVTFGLGVLVLIWATCGFPAVYGRALYWVWTTQTLVLWLIVPIVLLFGHPVQLARTTLTAGVDHLLRSRPARLVANPLIGPALVPVLSFVLFFGPVAGWSIEWPAFGWVLQVALLLVGAVMVLPLVGVYEEDSSLAVGLGLAVGSFELVLDALPGIILRLRTTLATSFFDHRAVYPWSPGALHDQQIAGAILWCVAEIIDLPFLLLVYRRWLRADERDAARVDAVLDAERAARRGLGEGSAADETGSARGDEPVPRDVPWWISDPAMQERLRRGG